MSNLAEKNFVSERSGTEAVRAKATMLRAVIVAIPVDERGAVFAQIRDLLPSSFEDKNKLPQRGGEVLNNVFRLFQQDPKAILGASAVNAELAKTGAKAPPQAVRNALNYLNGRSVLRRVGYGQYQLADGTIVEGPP